MLLAFVFAAFMAFVPADAQAHMRNENDARLVVRIDEAYYTDYDGDGKEDDIVTVFRIFIKQEADYCFNVEVECEIETPSGIEFEYEFEIETQYGFAATLVWLNTAIEPGWYKLEVEADAGGYVEDEDELVFDPPGKGGGEPPVIDMAMLIQF